MAMSTRAATAGDAPERDVVLAADDQPLNVIETPTSPSSAFALSRFEFEAGKGNEGTKILMVEWDSAALPPADDHDDWDVTWDGKTDGSALPMRGVAGSTTSHDAAYGRQMRRLYFLLPPGVAIPPLVSIRRGGAGSDADGSVLRTKPMPAIFPGSSSATYNALPQQRGVLHTLWAQQRLADLAAEIAAEAQTNSESVGLEIAIQEHAWIAEHFGLAPADGADGADTAPSADAARPGYLPSPQSPLAREHGATTASEAAAPSPVTSPHSPTGGKLGEKLRGLRLATSPAELAASAVAHPARPLGSLNAALHDPHYVPADEASAVDDELFALPLSPRSPDMAKSPFSTMIA